MGMWKDQGPLSGPSVCGILLFVMTHITDKSDRKERNNEKMVFDLSFPLFAILAAYLILGAILSVAGGMLLGALLNRLRDLRISIQPDLTSHQVAVPSRNRGHQSTGRTLTLDT
jgi:hypothetical protein